MPSYLHPASMHCAPHAQDRGANVPAHPNSRELAAPTHIYFCTESQSCIPPQSRAYHLDSLPYTRSRDPRSMTTSELPAYTKAWEERERRGSVDSMRSDTSEDGPREPGSSSVPWLAYQPPQHAADEPLKSAPAYDGWYRDVVERLAAGGSLDAPEFAAILAKEVDATHALVPVGERN
ncbi:uncharacterized protein SCHCODRAFT_02751426 [Schizophyllum commune H4-8]|nr:uncharacterized protein SCHCODRAFT_02751426 [Schizophyllum commune H4-8]KAI5888255.1 hypothetical protein SCHCODRAFT_02751426 [Schizophyllum commune H4-8]